MPARRRRKKGAHPRLGSLLLGVLLVVGAGAVIARAGTEQPTVTATATATSSSPTDQARPARRTDVPVTARAAPPPRPAPATAPAPASTPARPAARTSAPTTAPPATPVPGPTSPAASASQVVALTFDAGADRGYAEDILDLLRAERVPASFVVTGQWARANPDLVRRIAAERHLVINHTFDHQSFTGVSDHRGGLDAARRRAELEDADAILAPLIGHSSRPWYRLPYGDDDARVAGDVAPLGYTRKVGWTIDTLGWRGRSAADIIDRSLRIAAPGAIYVLHVGRASQDGPALARIVTGLRERGFEFVTVETLR